MLIKFDKDFFPHYEYNEIPSPSPTRSLVASLWIQNDTHDRTTINMHGT